MWLIFLLYFFPELITIEWAHYNSKWTQPNSSGCTTTRVWFPSSQFFTHCHPDYPERAVGREVRVPSLLHRVLRGAGECVAVPIPLLPQWRRWEVHNFPRSLLFDVSDVLHARLYVMICYTHLGRAHSLPCPWVCTIHLIRLAYSAHLGRSSPYWRLKQQALPNPFLRNSILFD